MLPTCSGQRGYALFFCSNDRLVRKKIKRKMFLVEIMKDSPAFCFGGVRPVQEKSNFVLEPNLE